MSIALVIAYGFHGKYALKKVQMLKMKY